MHFKRKAIYLLGLAFTPVLSLQADNALLIGGGYNLEGSQGQIELNVKWVQEVLKQSGLPITTYFTDGDDTSPDVHYLHRATDENQAANAQIESEEAALNELALRMEPLARLFGNHQANTKRYRNHLVPNVAGSTEASKLTVALEKHLEANAGDPTLLVYNGHGSQSKSSTDQVTMELWNNTQMSASELHGVLEKSKAPTRFIFTQCYSGGFHRLAYANPEKGLELSTEQRCGFTAESAYRLAEGCSAAVDSNDYRDYTTYFFAALNGYDRNGGIVPIETDTDKNGEVSLREAHLYTLGNAHSTDLSRSTSEDYLNTWQPWYLKWAAPSTSLPNNEYARLYRDLAARHKITLDKDSAKTIRAQLAEHKNTLGKLETRQVELKRETRSIQKDLHLKAAAKWPALGAPYTAGFQELANSGELISISDWIGATDEYQSLVALQTQSDAIINQHLDAERNLTQMQKLIEFRRLARLKQQIYQYGSNEDMKSYESLVSCEEQPLNINKTSGLIQAEQLSD